MSRKRKAANWIAGVRTVSTYPPPGTFAKPAREIARIMARRDVSPMGIGSGIRMIQYFINRSGRNLAPGRRRELEKAKRMLQERVVKERGRRAR